ncbi:MAG: F0F1 ATP synthase subunit A, partial [Luteolibacter sp.]
MRLSVIISTLLTLGLAPCAVAAGAGHVMPLYAESIWDGIPITNSMVMTWIATLLIILFSRAATHRMSLIPVGLQNLAEWMVESLYTFLEGLIGRHMVARTFWFLGSIFFLVITVNYLGLLPGVGTLGRMVVEDGHSHYVPFLRGGNADLNMTAAMALLFALLWFYWAISENGFKGFLSHIFAPKGSFKGWMLGIMIPVF